MVLLVGVAAAGLIAPHQPLTNHPVLIAAALSPYLVYSAGLALALVVAWITRRRLITVAVLALTIAALVAPVMVHPRGGSASAPHQLRVLTANLRLGEADAGTLLDSARRERPDVVALQELTPDAVQRLAAAGLDAEFPHHIVFPLTDAAGAGLWSKYPIRDHSVVPGFEMVFIRVRIAMPAASDPRILVAHVAGPWPQPIDTWRRDLAALDRTMGFLAAEPDTSPILIAGDFNATSDMRPFRELLRNGFTDSAAETGGTIRTYRQDVPVPPLIGIDHVLLRNAEAVAARGLPLPGSDHRALLVDVRVPAR